MNNKPDLWLGVCAAHVNRLFAQFSIVTMETIEDNCLRRLDRTKGTMLSCPVTELGHVNFNDCSLFQ